MKICVSSALAACVLLALFVFAVTQAQANQSAVELTRFELRPTAAGVEIHWETATEVDIAYFKVKRGPAPDGPFLDLNGIGLVEALGSTVSGSTYMVVDETAPSSGRYHYQLFELTLSNEEHIVAEGDVVLGSAATPDAIVGRPPTATPAPTTGAQNATATLQATTSAGAGTSAPSPAATRNGNATATITASVPATTTTAAATPAATRGGATLGPTPTRFSFTPQAQNAAPSSPAGDATVVEAAAPQTLAQVTSEAYPAPGGALPTPFETDVVTDPAGLSMPEQEPLSYPGAVGDTGGALPGSVGSGVQGAADPGTQLQDEPAGETPGTTRLLLWLGFLAAFFIFIGGIAFSIVLSTRRREHDLP